MNNTKYSIDSNDFLLIQWQDIAIPEGRYYDKRISYYQNDVCAYSCSIHWCMSTIANNFNITFTLDDRKEIWKQAIKLWADPNFGWDMLNAVKLVRNYVRDIKWINLVYFRVPYTLYEEVTKKGFNIVCWYRNRSWFTKDRMDNCIVGENIDEYWDRNYGHLISLYWNNWLWYVDNFPAHTKCNETKIVNIDKLVQAWVFFESWYIYTYVDPIKKWFNWLTLQEKIAKLKWRDEVKKYG